MPPHVAHWVLLRLDLLLVFWPVQRNRMAIGAITEVDQTCDGARVAFVQSALVGRQLVQRGCNPFDRLRREIGELRAFGRARALKRASFQRPVASTSRRTSTARQTSA